MTLLHMGSKTWVFLNSNRVVNEIISKKGAITNERPYMPIASGLVSRDNRFFLQRTARWTEARRMIHHLLSGHALKTYGEYHELESLQLLAAYLHRPHEWYSHHYRYCVSTMHRIVSGERLLKATPELDNMRRVTNEFIRSMNSSIVDFFPGLSRLPKILQPWRGRYAKMGQEHYNTFCAWWKPVKKALADGTAPPSFVRDVLFDKDTGYNGTDEEAMYIAVSTIAAGSDNPRLTMNCFTMAALCHPEVLQKARDEIDEHCGSAQRLPRVNDMPAMPYMCALMKEVIRWRPALPMVPQHQLTQDLEFEGYFFPAGTDFVINGTAVSKDFDDPEAFKPERWLDGNEKNIIHGMSHFGGGRRICVGYKTGQTQLFVALARLVYCFDYAAVRIT